jgi:hypothetical protein
VGVHANLLLRLTRQIILILFLAAPHVPPPFLFTIQFLFLLHAYKIEESSPLIIEVNLIYKIILQKDIKKAPRHYKIQIYASIPCKTGKNIIKLQASLLYHHGV